MVLSGAWRSSKISTAPLTSTASPFKVGLSSTVVNVTDSMSAEVEDIEVRPSKRPRLSPLLSDLSEPPQAADSNETNPNGAFPSTGNLTDTKELEVGITAYVSDDTVPFRAVLKKRYTDFLVNEVSTNGQVVHLTTITIPPEFRSQKANRGDLKEHRTEENAGIDSVVQTGEPDRKVRPGADLQGQPAVDNKSQAQSSDGHMISEEDKVKLTEYLNPQAVTDLLSLHQAILKQPQKKPRDHIAVRTEFTTDRARRAEIHGAIRRIFSSRVDSTTDKDGVLVLTAAPPGVHNRQSRNQDGKPSGRPGKMGWIERGGEHLHFTLYKENKDTMEVISWLVRQMKVNAKVFQFAGTKDRRAVTAQRVSAHRIDMERLLAQNRNLRNACVGDFAYSPHGLELGDLNGNEFTLTVRECDISSAANISTGDSLLFFQKSLQAAMDSLHARGFLNYYGLQRFGTFATRTDEVGLHILQGDFETACLAILRYDSTAVASPHEIEATLAQDGRRPRQTVPDDNLRATALDEYKTTSNLSKALSIMPRRFTAETMLLRHLHKQPADYVGALMTIPRNLRLMYVHAYQSLVWNSAVTNRWQTFGSKVMEGDLVLVSEHKGKENYQLDSSRGNIDERNDTDTKTTTVTNGTHSSNQDIDNNNDSNNAVDADGEIIIEPAVHDRSNTTEDMFERARPLTLAEASSNLYTIFDIVLPLPGFDVVYPSYPSLSTNEADQSHTKTFYDSFMATHNLNPHDMRRRQRDFSLSGGYRKILSRIEADYSVEVRPYHNDEEQFVTTDMERLTSHSNSTPAKGQTVRHDGQGHDVIAEDEEKAKEEPPSQAEAVTAAAAAEPKVKIAAVLKFRLGASQYATMALRELSRGGIISYRPEIGIGRGN